MIISRRMRFAVERQDRARFDYEVERAARRKLLRAYRVFLCRRMVVLAARVAIAGRRAFLPPYLCPLCEHHAGPHHIVRMLLSITRDGDGTRVRGCEKITWRCGVGGCRCRGAYLRDDPASAEQAMVSFLARAVRRAHERVR